MASTSNANKFSFEQRMQAVTCQKSDINALILDYLTTEGYANAAAKFSKEANLPPQQDHLSIKARQDIQQLIMEGSFSASIEALNELDSQLLEEDDSLHFTLLRLHLVELIRTYNADGGEIGPLLTYAREQLGSQASVDNEKRTDLENTMALLLIPQNELEPHLAALLDPSARLCAADRVNKAILDSHKRRTVAGIRSIVKMRCWAESNAREAEIPLPSKLYIGLENE